MKLKENLENAISDIVKEFENKHECELEYWVSDDITGIACFGDVLFLNLSDICFDIFTNQPKELIFKWIYDCIDYPDQNINFKSYSMGLRFEDLKQKEDYKDFAG